MSRVTKWLLLIAVFLPALGIAWVFFWPPLYWAEAIEAHVVDAETGQPLEGVIITVNWELRNFLSAYPEGQIAVMETVTDAQGKFTFPAWGPRLRRSLWGFLKYAPQFLFFKSGYEPMGLENEFGSTNNTGIIRHSDWNGKVIKLKRFTGGMEEYARQLGFLNTSLETFVRHGGNCEWKQVPRMLLALDQQQQLFKVKGFYFSLLSIDDLPAQSKCGSAREYLRSYLP